MRTTSKFTFSHNRSLLPKKSQFLLLNQTLPLHPTHPTPLTRHHTPPPHTLSTTTHPRSSRSRRKGLRKLQECGSVRSTARGFVDRRRNPRCIGARLSTCARARPTHPRRSTGFRARVPFSRRRYDSASYFRSAARSWAPSPRAHVRVYIPRASERKRVAINGRARDRCRTISGSWPAIASAGPAA